MNNPYSFDTDNSPARTIQSQFSHVQHRVLGRSVGIELLQHCGRSQVRVVRFSNGIVHYKVQNLVREHVGQQLAVNAVAREGDVDSSPKDHGVIIIGEIVVAEDFSG
ncbi:hypothetical protein RHMOL_Rhmol04G0077500 [Rhododendron molle]|uniref:Uncharacterized protein n=1 Tax=Rhododendron molle TaxID=49168 RepID=A0ACC0P096_RHOML|nr:hypothetical protein RHMOL_Rhmol04G0077500 [Rhododendron molle]